MTKSTTPVVIAEAPVTCVVVMEDRAQVTRRSHLTLEVGLHVIRVEGVTPLVADRTLRSQIQAAEKKGNDLPRVLGGQVQRQWVCKGARPEEEKRLGDAIDEQVDRYLSVLDNMHACRNELGAVAEVAAARVEQINEHLAVTDFDPQWKEELSHLFNRQAAIETNLLQEQTGQEERLLRLMRLESQRSEVLQPSSQYMATLVTEVSMPIAGEVTVEWEYQVPCAVWRPSYRAELQQPGQSPVRVRWESAGMVWQRTGEDWNKVELRFSTARPSLSAEVPLLVDDLLDAREKSDQERKSVEVTSRDAVIATTTKAPDHHADTPPGLDDGGETRTYVVPRPVDVPSDGRPHRIVFETFEAEAQTELRCVPEMADWAFLRSIQANQSSMPLLAGPVMLVKEGGYVGRSQVPFVAAWEPFELSWGSEDGLVVVRDATRRYENVGLRNRRQYTYLVRIWLTNHTGAPQQLSLVERVPVSEIEQVEVRIVEANTSKGYERDSQGLMLWAQDLPVGAEKQLTLSFTVQMPQSVTWSE